MLWYYWLKWVSTSCCQHSDTLVTTWWDFGRLWYENTKQIQWVNAVFGTFFCQHGQINAQLWPGIWLKRVKRHFSFNIKWIILVCWNHIITIYCISHVSISQCFLRETLGLLTAAFADLAESRAVQHQTFSASSCPGWIWVATAAYRSLTMDYRCKTD